MRFGTIQLNKVNKGLKKVFYQRYKFMRRKGLIAALISVLSVILFFSVFAFVWYVCDVYPDFGKFTKQFEIPGLKDGAIPQGLCNYKSGNDTYFFTSAYMADGSPSRVYVNKNDEYVGYFTMKYSADDKENAGNDYSGHCCGVATNGRFFWVVSENNTYCLRLSDVNSDKSNNFEKLIDVASSNGCVTFTSYFDTHNGADFCYFQPSSEGSSYGSFYVGEFYRAKSHEQSVYKSHKQVTPAGDENKAVIFRYSVNTSSDTANKTGISLTNDKIIPNRAYSTTDRLQGMAVTYHTDAEGGRKYDGFVVSQSYGLANSHLYYYDYETACGSSAKHERVKYEGISNEIDTFYLDSASLINDYEIPSMSEGLCNDANTVYVLNESAGKKYRLFTRQRVKNVYSFVPKHKDEE